MFTDQCSVLYFSELPDSVVSLWTPEFSTTSNLKAVVIHGSWTRENISVIPTGRADFLCTVTVPISMYDTVQQYKNIMCFLNFYKATVSIRIGLGTLGF